MVSALFRLTEDAGANPMDFEPGCMELYQYVPLFSYATYLDDVAANTTSYSPSAASLKLPDAPYRGESTENRVGVG